MQTLVIGIGNRYRGDDAAGILVARRVRELAHGVRVSEEEGDLTSLMERWEGADRVVLVDAVVTGASLGTVHRFELRNGPLPADLFRASTHTLSLAELLELARVLGRLPRQLVLYGVEGGDFRAGAGLSTEVEGALDELARRITSEIERGEP